MEITEAAACTHAWWQTLDPAHAEREALLIAGVPAATAHTLYPLDLATLVPGLVRHLRAIRPVLPEQASVHMMRYAFQLMPHRKALPSAAAMARDAYWQVSITKPGGLMLAAELMLCLPMAVRRADVANDCAENLWYAWYFMHHLDAFEVEGQEIARGLASWYGKHVFKLF